MFNHRAPLSPSHNFNNYENKLGNNSMSKGYGFSMRNYANGNANIYNDDQYHDRNFGQLQYMLENERKKFKQAKQKYQYDLDTQRKLRIEFQNKLIKLKEEFSRKEIIISQTQFKINNLLHQNQDLVLENQRFKSQICRLEEIYGAKVHQLESKLSIENKNYDDMISQYNIEFEKFKKEGQEYVEQITFDFERKIKSLEERSKTAQIAKKELSLENKKLNDILISNKLVFQEQIRDLKNRAREEQIKKTQQITKSYDQKMKMIEDSKESIIRKNSELLRLLQDKDREIEDIQTSKNDQISRLRLQNSDFSQQVTHLNYLITKLKSQVAEKDSMLGRSYADNDGQLQTLKQQLQLKKQQIFQLNSTVKDLRMVMKSSQGQWESKRRDIAQRCAYYERQARKYKDQYERICEVLKSRINDTINNTVSYKKA